MSRARKEILIISDRPADGANLAYVLRLRLRVDAWTLPCGIDRLPQYPACTVILCSRRPISILSLASQAETAYPKIPVLYIELENEAQLHGDHLAFTRVLHKPTMEEQIEAVRLMVVRKRGPKPARHAVTERVTA